MNKKKKLKRSHKRRVATIRERYGNQVFGQWGHKGATSLWKKIRSGIPV